jgi:L-arabinose isomerase
VARITRGFSVALTDEHPAGFFAMAGIEFLLINRETKRADLKKELRWNDVYYLSAREL